jgi:hypothetical protein
VTSLLDDYYGKDESTSSSVDVASLLGNLAPHSSQEQQSSSSVEDSMQQLAELNAILDTAAPCFQNPPQARYVQEQQEWTQQCLQTVPAASSSSWAWRQEVWSNPVLQYHARVRVVRPNSMTDAIEMNPNQPKRRKAAAQK